MFRRLFRSSGPVVPLDRFSQEFNSSCQVDNFEGLRLDYGKCRDKLTFMATLNLGGTPAYPGYLWQLGPIYQSKRSVAALRIAGDNTCTMRFTRTFADRWDARLMSEVGFSKVNDKLCLNAVGPSCRLGGVPKSGA